MLQTGGVGFTITAGCIMGNVGSRLGLVPHTKLSPFLFKYWFLHTSNSLDTLLNIMIALLFHKTWTTNCFLCIMIILSSVGIFNAPKCYLTALSYKKKNSHLMIKHSKWFWNCPKHHFISIIWLFFFLLMYLLPSVLEIHTARSSVTTYSLIINNKKVNSLMCIAEWNLLNI